MRLILRPLSVVLLASLALSACGGGEDDEDDPPLVSEPQRGDVIGGTPARTASYTPEELVERLAHSLDEDLPVLPIEPKCTIDIYKVEYRTVDPDGELTPASAALMVPNDDADPDCSGARPIVMYAHGTSTDSAYNIADLENDENGEGLLIAATFAAEGYIVIAPNYVGYDTSTLGYHPYLNADQQSKDMIDALTAVRSVLPGASSPDTTASSKLFLTGYSQGGYVAMATHRALQDAGETVTASAPMSGPYALSAFGDAIFRGQVSGGGPVNLTLLLTSYQRAYGDIYGVPTDAFRNAFARGIETLLPNPAPISSLVADGKLPDDHVFSSTPPAAEYAALTPATAPADLAPVFAIGFGTNYLLTNSFRLAYLQDADANPDGAFPTVTDGLPPADPMNPLRMALKRNDLRDWTPESPVLMCGGDLDPNVFYFNTELMADYWASVAPDAPVTVLDIDSSAVTDDPYEDFKDGFSAAKDLVRAAAVLGGASDGGDAAVFQAYHAGLVAPFCLLSVKAFFDSN